VAGGRTVQFQHNQSDSPSPKLKSKIICQESGEEGDDTCQLHSKNVVPALEIISTGSIRDVVKSQECWETGNQKKKKIMSFRRQAQTFWGGHRETNLPLARLGLPAKEVGKELKGLGGGNSEEKLWGPLSERVVLLLNAGVVHHLLKRLKKGEGEGVGVWECWGRARPIEDVGPERKDAWQAETLRES